MVSYTDIMTKALAARKSFSRGGRVSINMPKNKENIKESMRREEKEDVALEQAKANVKKTKTSTEELQKAGTANRKRLASLSKALEPKPMTAMEKANLRGKKLDNISKGLKSATSFLPQVTQDTYSDWHNWIRESDFVPATTFKSPEEISKMTPVAFNVYKSKLSGMGGLNSKQLDNLYRTKAAEKIAQAKIDAAKKVADARVSANQKSTAEKFIKNSLNQYDSPEEMPHRIRQNYERSVAILEEELSTERTPEPESDPNENAPQAIQTATMLGDKISELTDIKQQAEIDPDILSKYKEMYPDKTDEEIINAYKNMQ